MTTRVKILGFGPAKLICKYFWGFLKWLLEKIVFCRRAFKNMNKYIPMVWFIVPVKGYYNWDVCRREINQFPVNKQKKTSSFRLPTADELRVKVS